MELFLTALSLGALAGWLAGGRLRNLLRLPLFGWPLILVWLALGLQVGLLLVPEPLLTPVLIGSYLLVALSIGVVFARVVSAGQGSPAATGVATIGLGWLLNVIVIAANGGMPFSPDALANGASYDPHDHAVLIPKRVPATEDTHLAALGDTIPLPLSGTFVSLGDIVLAAGVAMLVFAGMSGQGSTRTPVTRHV